MSGSSPFRRRLIEWAAGARDLGLHEFLRLLPTEVCSDLGAALAVAFGPRARPHWFERGRMVLAKLRPDLADPAALEAAALRIWGGMGRISAEFSVQPRFMREGRVQDARPGTLQALLDDPRPTIFCFLHLGSWEVAVMRLALLAPGRLLAIAMRPETPVQTRIMARCRARLPMEVLWMYPGIWRRVLERLRQPGGLAFIAGDEPDGGTIKAPFFGRPPRIDGNLGKMVRLAAATGARIVPIYAERRPGVRFVVHTLEPVEVAAAVSDEAVLAAVLRINALIEPVVRNLADQWLVAVGFGKDVKAIRPLD